MTLNPKNIALIVLGLFAVAIGGLYLVRGITIANQETTIKTQAKDIVTLQATQKALEGQVKDANDNAAVRRSIAQAQQAISNSSAAVREEMKKLKTKCVLEAQDEERINKNLVDRWNNRTSRKLLFTMPDTDGNTETY